MINGFRIGAIYITRDNRKVQLVEWDEPSKTLVGHVLDSKDKLLVLDSKDELLVLYDDKGCHRFGSELDLMTLAPITENGIDTRKG